MHYIKFCNSLTELNQQTLIRRLQRNEAYPFLIHVSRKEFPGIPFVSEDYNAKAFFRKIPESLPVIH